MADVGIEALIHNVRFSAFEDDVGLGHQVAGYDENGEGNEDIKEEGKIIDIGCETENEGIQDPDDDEKEQETDLDGVVVRGFPSDVRVFVRHERHFLI